MREQRMATTGRRPLPRPFTMPWGKGQIVEEVSCVGEWHAPAIQLMELEDGTTHVRFCYYNHSGQFQRGPLMLGASEMEMLHTELKRAPRLREALRGLLDDATD